MLTTYLREQYGCNIRVTHPVNELYRARRNNQTVGPRSRKEVCAHYVTVMPLAYIYKLNWLYAVEVPYPAILIGIDYNVGVL